jgi:hypothetical protein
VGAQTPSLRVLMHLPPGDKPNPDVVWGAEVARHCKGKIVIGKDRRSR